MRKNVWNRNCIAMGLASGFIEPLESTSIHLMQSAVGRLLTMFPDKNFDPSLVAEYNRQTRFEYERTRDFIALHYHATERDDTEFWRQCATMELPEGLAHRIERFRQSGHIFRDGEELFTPMGWLQVMIGQRILPQKYHPLVDRMSDDDLRQYVGDVKKVIASCVDVMPPHEAFIARYCAAPKI